VATVLDDDVEILNLPTKAAPKASIGLMPINFYLGAS
jgi:hypothetical protein